MIRLDTRQKIIISGYWIDNKDEFSNYVCVINDMSIKKDDDEIFYYFSSWRAVDYCRNKNNVGLEFVITNIEAY